MVENTQPDDELLIDDLETLKIISDPLRIQILELLLEPKTVKQIASVIGIPPTKLYYHVNLLEKHGVIRVVETNIVSGIIEKTYQIVAFSIRPAQSLFSLSVPESIESLDHVLSSVFDRTREDIMRSVQARVIDASLPEDQQRGSHKLHITRVLARLSPDRAESFYERLAALVEDFDEEGHGADEKNTGNYTLVIVMYPTVSSEEDNQDE